MFQYSQEAEGDEFHYIIIGLKESSTEDDMKKAYCSIARQFHPHRHHHPQVSDVMQIINKAKQ